MPVLTTPFATGLATNSTDVDWALGGETSATAPGGDAQLGGLGNATAPQIALILPYCDGPPLSQFTLRVWGWWNRGAPGDVNNVIWVPLLIAEFDCVAGVMNGLGSRLIKDNEFFVDTMTLTKGTVGMYGIVISPNGGGRAWAKVELQGAQKFQFACRAGNPAGFGNVLFSLTSDS